MPYSKTVKKHLLQAVLLVATTVLIAGCGASSPSSAPVNLWTWVSGSDVGNQFGTYGTQGTADAANVPGARSSAVSWIDSSGNLWLFGGLGYDSGGTLSRLNDLWRFDGSNWTWVSGSDVVSQAGSYGTIGVAAAANVPGARRYAISWTDTSGNLWLFGGLGYDSGGTSGSLNDLWRFDGTNWTWISGSDVINQAGTYGTKGITNAANLPGARRSSIAWTDSSGNLWLFGGYGRDGGGTMSYLNDLWRFDGRFWTWISGSNVVDQPGSYGTQGAADAANVPGARESSNSWTDANGNLWLFGGYGYNSGGTLSNLNDLWRFDGSNWTWISGSDVGNQFGTYGIRGTADAANVPGVRYGSTSWTDSSGNLWLFGGYGYDSGGTFNFLNDLWRFDGINWTWISGSDVVDQVSTYGTKGTADAANVPGARQSSITWTDSSGNLWLFGGYGYDSGTLSYLNDLWRYEP